jgi:pyridoxine/pyridoxamine 5'-phosphate oxidase
VWMWWGFAWCGGGARQPSAPFSPCTACAVLLPPHGKHTLHHPALQVPRPPHWGGYLLRPLSVEFWQGRPSRLHDRLRYVREAADYASPWRLERLAP